MHPTRNKLLWQRLALMLFILSIMPMVSAADWTYRVRLHDNIWDLSSRYLKPDVPWQKLQDYNKVADPYHLPPGMTLHVPIEWLRVQPANAQVIAVIGNAHVQLPGQTQSVPVTTGMTLAYGAHLNTDANASLSLQFADGSRVLMQDNSELDLDQMRAYGRTGMVDTRLRLQHGRVSSAVTPMTGAAAHFSVETPGTVSSVRGTHFRVAADADTSQTEVITGRVEVAGDHAGVLVQKGLGVAVANGSRPTQAQPLLAAPDLHCPAQPINQLPYAFAWAPLAGATNYRVQMAVNDRFEALLLDHITSSPQAALPDVPDSDYAVRVRGIDASKLEGEDSICVLHISGHPQPPLVMEPLPGSKVRDTRPRFRWTENLQAISYVWQLASDTQFTQLLDSETKVTGDNVRASQALPYGRYYWRIASRDSNGKQGPFSDPMPFDLVPQPPAPEVGKSTSSHHQVSLGWQTGTPGQRYHIQLDRDSHFTHPQVDQTLDQPVLQIQKPGSGTWFVRVQTIDTDGYAGPWGEVQKIHIACISCRIAAVAGGGAVVLWILL
ncbi:LysM peptidoglycan-binding domain-containing protein [Dyella dinghuensis]|uniref:LysM peptidoglycan-binding domain-containing protein n=1 Tax=Dyella dinghuensis TaxID=1920169 RepID=A0A3S0S4V5_9GAMM|nr:FecR domain-containing protein [Dyella dinghuensis]RUL66009.1 LysM peptidoglycan-binding domain-containing protein [Dyella dinghuensis]